MGFLGVVTLGISVSSCKLASDTTGNLSDRFRIVAIFNNAFLGVSSASKLDVVGVGGVIRILIISSAAYCKK